jgi:MFS family permease
MNRAKPSPEMPIGLLVIPFAFSVRAPNCRLSAMPTEQPESDAADPPRRHFPPRPLSPPTPDPPDPYARVRQVLHVTAVGAFYWWGKPFRGALIALFAACEIAAFALKPREVSDKPVDTLDTRMRLGCGAAFGIVFGLLATFTWGYEIHWETVTGAQLVAFATVGMVVGAFLALRFGERFWRWVSDRPYWVRW